MYRLDGARPSVPYRLHHFIFEVRERRPNTGSGLCTRCHGTVCTTRRGRRQGLFGNWDEGENRTAAVPTGARFRMQSSPGSTFAWEYELWLITQPELSEPYRDRRNRLNW